MSSGIASIEVTVQASDIDELGHVNNQVYVRWIEMAARHASDTKGWTSQRYLEHDFAWVAREHWIEYLRPCELGDKVTVYTWLEAAQGYRCLRRYAMVRGGKLCSIAATEWNFINLTTRRAMSCPPEVMNAFTLVPPESEELKEKGIARALRYQPEGLLT